MTPWRLAAWRSLASHLLRACALSTTVGIGVALVSAIILIDHRTSLPDVVRNVRWCITVLALSHAGLFEDGRERDQLVAPVSLRTVRTLRLVLFGSIYFGSVLVVMVVAVSRSSLSVPARAWGEAAIVFALTVGCSGAAARFAPRRVSGAVATVAVFGVIAGSFLLPADHRLFVSTDRAAEPISILWWMLAVAAAAYAVLLPAESLRFRRRERHGVARPI